MREIKNVVSQIRGAILPAFIALLFLAQGPAASGLLQKSSFGAAVSVSGENKSAVQPVTMKLGEIVANPYSDEGQSIQFTLTVPQKVTLKLYSQDDREVMTLFQGVEQPGTYWIPLPSSKLPTGNYLCRLAGQGLDVKYLVLSKQMFRDAKPKGGNTGPVQQ
jgi:hypothetical protein